MKKERTLWGLFGWSALISVFMVLVCFIYWNLPYTYGQGDDKIMSWAKNKDIILKDKFDTNVFAVNISYDKVLTPKKVVEDHGGIKFPKQIGETAIVDRGELYAFLQFLKETDNYRYVVCDIALNTAYKTEYDDSLFATIASMRDIVVADSENLPECLSSKAAVAAYQKKHVYDDFMKYSCLIDGHETVAFRMWKDISGCGYEEKWLGLQMDGQRRLMSFVPDFRFAIYDDYYLEDGQPHRTVHNLGYDIVNSISIEGLDKKLEDKIVLIGSWKEEDIHDTVIGSQPGISIIYNAYLGLVHKDNRIPVWIYVLLLLMFWAQAVILLRKIYHECIFSLAVPENRFLRFLYNCLIFSGIKRPENRFWRYFVLVISYPVTYYTFPIALLALIIFISSGLYVNALLIGMLFSLADDFVSDGYDEEWNDAKKRKEQDVKES